MICIVAAPEGVKVLEERHPEVEIFTAALDEGLNDGRSSCRAWATSATACSGLV